MKIQHAFLILVILICLGFLVRAFSGGTPWGLFNKQIQATKASGRAH
jgi:hypothetical protein